MFQAPLDTATTAFVLVIIVGTVTGYVFWRQTENTARLDRVEKVLKGYCINRPKAENCAEIDLPLRPRL